MSRGTDEGGSSEPVVSGEKVSGRARFLADAMVADLARWLRILGEDCRWVPPEWSDDRVLAVAREQDRVLVSRDDALVRRAADSGVTALRVPQGEVERALFHVYRTCGLEPRASGLSTRCSRCNGELMEVDAKQAHLRAEEAGKAPPLPEVQERHQVFWSCMACGHAYWRGTHWEEIERVRRRLLGMLGIQ